MNQQDQMINIELLDIRDLNHGEISNEDIAYILSHEWKNRAYLCSKDLSNLVKSKLELIDKYIDMDQGQLAEEELEDLDLLYGFVSEIEEILSKYKNYPLPTSIIYRIQYFEREVYSRYMTNDIFEELRREEEERDNIIHEVNSMFQKIDQMWDENVSEENIKKFIEEKLRTIFNIPDSAVIFLRDALFIDFTANRNVRVTLSEDQINSLKRDTGRNGTCGTCLEDYTEHEEMVILHCDGEHTFHENCIVPWLKMSVYCPICRYDLRK